MYLKTLTLSNFRSFEQTDIRYAMTLPSWLARITAAKVTRSTLSGS